MICPDSTKRKFFPIGGRGWGPKKFLTDSGILSENI